MNLQIQMVLQIQMNLQKRFYIFWANQNRHLVSEILIAPSCIHKYTCAA